MPTPECRSQRRYRTGVAARFSDPIGWQSCGEGARIARRWRPMRGCAIPD